MGNSNPCILTRPVKRRSKQVRIKGRLLAASKIKDHKSGVFFSLYILVVGYLLELMEDPSFSTGPEKVLLDKKGGVLSVGENMGETL